MTPVEQQTQFEARVVTATRLLSNAFRAPSPLLAVSLGLSELSLAAMTTPADADLSALEVLPALLFDLTPAVAERCAPDLAPEDVYLGMGHASAMAKMVRDQFADDRIAYARIFAARLEIVAQQRGIRDRGAPLDRALRIHRALIEPRPPNAPLH